MKYVAVKGSHLSDEQAQVYGDRIELLQESHDGEVSPAGVLEDARGVDSPLYGYFEWDDQRAAERYRIVQAQYLLRSINVLVQTANGWEETRAFVHVSIQEEAGDAVPQRVYVSVRHAMTDMELREQTLEQAFGQLVAWRRKYAQYQELARVFGAIDAVQEVLDLAPVVEQLVV